MAKLTLAQVEYLSQHLTDQFKDVERFASKASLELEMARKTLNELLRTYDQWIVEKEIDNEW
jgi:uncharacterized protein YgbK (DUF1537 family)